ncbi:MAG: hypothetical protein COA44_04640 [Arcobacter sp.]|nr:MAG: hypothetical protein COA44_04640 [Arcobacter sp.]
MDLDDPLDDDGMSIDNFGPQSSIDDDEEAGNEGSEPEEERPSREEVAELPPKRNINSEMMVNIENIQDLISSVEYASIQLKKANDEAGKYRDNENYSAVLNELQKLQKEVKKVNPDSIDLSPLNNVMFEIEEFNKFKSYVSTFKFKSIWVSLSFGFLGGSILASVLVLVFQYPVIALNVKRTIKKDNYLVSRKSFNIKKNGDGSFTVIKKGNKNEW